MEEKTNYCVRIIIIMHSNIIRFLKYWYIYVQFMLDCVTIKWNYYEMFLYFVLLEFRMHWKWFIRSFFSLFFFFFFFIDFEAYTNIFLLDIQQSDSVKRKCTPIFINIFFFFLFCFVHVNLKSYSVHCAEQWNSALCVYLAKRKTK